MKNRQRLGYLTLGVVAGFLVLLTVLGWSRFGTAVAAQSDSAGAPQAVAPQSSGPGVDPATPLQPGDVPVVQIPPLAPGANQGTVGTAQMRIADGPAPSFDLSAAGVQPAPDLATARRIGEAPQTGPGLLGLVPDSGALGNDTAYLSLSPDVIPLSTGQVLAMVATGFRPLEVIAIYTGGQITGYVQANTDGAAWASFTRPSGLGFIWFRVQGLYSGKMAGGSVQVSNTAPSVPGLAVGPHSVRPGDSLYMYGVRYTAGISVTVARNTASLGPVPVDGLGRTAPIVITVGANPNGDAVYNTYQSGVAAATLAGQSVEERSDAGPGGNNNLSRLFIDRPVLSNTVTTTIGLVGEGFQPGETVNLVRQPGTPLGSSVADSDGAVAFFVQSPAGAAVYDLRLTGQTSGRLGYGALLVDSKAYNVPTSIIAPSRATTNGNITALFTRYSPNFEVALKVDGIIVGAVNSGTGGFNSVVRPKPTTGPIVHDYAFSETFGSNVSSAPLAMVRSGAIHGTVLDAGSGQPIKALLHVGNDPGAYVMSDPQAGGVYTITVPAGGTSVTVFPSGCYVQQTLPVTVLTDTAVTLNFSVARSPNDMAGYTCYQNAGRAFQAAPNQVFGNTFNDNSASFSLPFPVRFYGTDVTTGTISSDGFITLGSQFNCPPNCYNSNTNIPNSNPPNGFVAANWDDLAGYGSDPQSGVYSGVVGTAPNRVFIVEWRNVRDYNDGTNALNTFEIQIPEAITGLASDIYLVYPTFNVGMSDGNSGTIGSENYAGTTGKQVQANTNGGLQQEPNNYIWAGDSIRIWKSIIPTNTPTPTITRTPTETRTPATPSPTRTPTPETCRSDANYVQTLSASIPIVPGTTDIGNHGDNVDTQINLPFSYTFYDQTFTTADVSSNGVLQFSGTSTEANNVQIPTNLLHDAIAAYWDDLRTDGSGGVGIYTSVTGAAPNRVFNIEWRACIFNASGCSGIDTNFEIRLFEGQQKLEIVYGTPLAQGGNGATVGIQKLTGGNNLYRQFSFNQAILYSGLRITYARVLCNTPTVTNTPTITRSPTNTPTRTPIPTLPAGTLTPVSVCGPVPVHFFASSLDGSQAIPPNTSQGIGTGSFSLDSATQRMDYSINFQNLASQETGAVIGVGGPGVVGPTITVIPAGNPAIGFFTFPSQYLAQLYNGQVYVQINSAAFQSGEIRGQLAEQCLTTPLPTNTRGPSPTPPPGVTWTPVRTPTPGPSPTSGTCTIAFNDVHSTDYFYEGVTYLYCRAIITGYGCAGRAVSGPLLPPLQPHHPRAVLEDGGAGPGLGDRDAGDAELPRRADHSPVLRHRRDGSGAWVDHRLWLRHGAYRAVSGPLLPPGQQHHPRADQQVDRALDGLDHPESPHGDLPRRAIRRRILRRGRDRV